MNKQTILITGASSGFGRLTAETLARKGHTVFAGLRGVEGRNAAAAGELKALAGREGLALHPLELDVTDDGSVRAGVERALREAGRLDVAINNAGVMAAGLDEAFTDEQWRALLETNLLGAQRVIRAVLPHLRERRAGLLVSVSSNMAQLTFPFAGLYTATKRALEGLAESYRYQLAPLGIDSVIVEPGGFPTALFSKLVGPADAERLAGYGPLAQMPQKVFGGFAASLQGPDAPNPQAVADAIARLVEAPAGTRPLRTVVDFHAGDGVRAINEVSERVQAQLFGAYGMTDLLSVKPA